MNSILIESAVQFPLLIYTLGAYICSCEVAFQILFIFWHSSDWGRGRIGLSFSLRLLMHAFRFSQACKSFGVFAHGNVIYFSLMNIFIRLCGFNFFDHFSSRLGGNLPVLQLVHLVILPHLVNGFFLVVACMKCVILISPLPSISWLMDFAFSGQIVCLFHLTCFQPQETTPLWHINILAVFTEVTLLYFYNQSRQFLMHNCWFAFFTPLREDFLIIVA